MSWPIKLRAMSFAVTMGVTITESVMGSLPIAFALWYFNIASGKDDSGRRRRRRRGYFALDINLFTRASC